jgi:hypothetical protein
MKAFGVRAFARGWLNPREARRKSGCYTITISSTTVALGRDETLTSVTAIKLNTGALPEQLLLLERTIGADGLERSDGRSVGAGNMHRIILCLVR